MKNFNLFMNEKKEKLKIAGSIVGGVTIIALSSCNVSNVKNDNSSVETSTLNSISTTTIPDNNTTSYSTTSNKTQITVKETTAQTTTVSTTTKVPETVITTITTRAPETITTTVNEVIITPSPVTTNIPATAKTVESTTEVTTKITQTTTKTTTTKKEEPIEYETRTDEIIGYYNSIELNNTTKLTKQNVNNYEDFLSVSNNLYRSTSFIVNENNICFYTYWVDYNLDTNKYEYESYESTSKIEKIILLTLLNENYVNDDTLKKILKPYTKDELIGITSYIWTIFCYDLADGRYYDYSKIIIDNNLKKTMINVQNAYNKKDYKTLEKLCNENFGKYSDIIDVLLLCYEYPFDEIKTYPTDKHAYNISLEIIDNTGIYDRAHQKVLVKQ